MVGTVYMFTSPNSDFHFVKCELHPKWYRQLIMLLLVDLLLLVFAVVQGMQAPTKCECDNSMHGQSIHV
jgi:hypothetical protein